MKILFVAADPKPERWTNLIQQHLPGAEIQVWQPDMPSWGADYAIVWHPPAALFDKEPQLKAIFNMGAGIDALVRMSNLPRNIPVVRLEDAGMSVQMAEYVAYHVIGISRDMDAYREQQAAGQWKLRRPIERSEWPVGVLGLGQIGQRVARTFAGLDYPVCGWARSSHAIDGVRSFAGEAELDHFLGETRVLINTLPLTDSTRDLIDYEVLSRLRPDAVVINVGRGEHLVDEDLCRAIEEGRVSRAVLDVFREEPLPTTHPFWSMPQVTITPHVSARTLREATISQISEKILALEQGQAISGVVDVERGY
ncbi:glyoxylate reductase [Stutzerimonas stutzeri]|uniref:Glyoxylate reductase n=1 Tax=Stutzerimonas stutzeri TaxID=316 RepID=W8R0D0_STUST|nr:glyoxylate/hydroxypyruvate reductase A [Stutzerimonas stutzeri]AHL76350.1 glyoxylate reductase [Stutzerimonas stutzeri]MCQ4329582.1 glyoxylate/hydroxypyruvate reductase A [Stutzerimonas stutzeri]